MNTLRVIIATLLILSVLAFSNSSESRVTITKVDKLKLTSITITGMITQDVTQYLPVIRALNLAKRGDTVIFTITSQGGYDSSANKIIKALGKTKARTIGTVKQYAASNGAYLLCHMDIVRLNPKAEIMFHAGGTSFPRNMPYTDIIKFATLSLNASIAEQSVCVDKGLITRNELDLMREGGDVWISGATINKRLKKLNETKRKK